MSAELYSTRGNNAGVSGTPVGGSKPLHRFMRVQPKTIGIILLVLGICFIIASIALMFNHVLFMWSIIQPGILQGILFIICGILYILTEHNPTKKTVTISLALSIVTLLMAVWTILHSFPNILHGYYRRKHYHEFDDNGTETNVFESTWSSYYEAMGLSLEAIFLTYSIVGAVIFTLMSVMAGASLRSTKSQAIIVMTTTAAETPVE